MTAISYYHVDVFSAVPFSGNGLAVFPDGRGISARHMQQLTQEMRHFESIFLERLGSNQVRARVFTMEEELDFAGHPVLGAAALLHELYAPTAAQASWTFELNAKTVAVDTVQSDGSYVATMNQGVAKFGPEFDLPAATEWLRVLNLRPDQLAPNLPVQLVSTGLPHVLVPLHEGIAQARIVVADLEDRLHAVGAKFIGVLEVPTLRMRTWDNAGIVEDIATGSLAGPAGAFLVQHCQQAPAQPLVLHQGEFVHRSSELTVEVRPQSAADLEVLVSGRVCLVASGTLAPGLSALLRAD